MSCAKIYQQKRGAGSINTGEMREAVIATMQCSKDMWVAPEGAIIEKLDMVFSSAKSKY